MSSAPTAPARQSPQEPSALAGVLSYLIPGLGQIYQGRYGKGILFMVSLLGMFHLGEAMGQWQNVYVPRTDKRPEGKGGHLSELPAGLMTRWHYAGQFWIGASAWPALWQYFGMSVPDKETQPFWHQFQKAPEETPLNLFLVRSDKTPDLGWVYTVIAGMLNILVIYDAYAGPVFLPWARPSSKEKELAGQQSTVKQEGAA